jgi:hypothetical protein
MVVDSSFVVGLALGINVKAFGFTSGWTLIRIIFASSTFALYLYVVQIPFSL